MIFNRISDTELRCKISIEEIKERGFELSDLMSKNQKAWEFFETVIEEGEDATGFEKEGPMSVEGSFVGKELELIFRSVDMDSEEMRKAMESAQTEGRSGAEFSYEPVISKKMAEDEAVHLEPIAVGFPTMDKLLDFSRRVVAKETKISLYTIYDSFVLVYDLDECDHDEVGQFCQLANEYASRVVYGEPQVAYLYEHGLCITKDFKAF
mgnify:CR=1 FL=1